MPRPRIVGDAEANFRHLFSQYKRGAKNRNLKFDLTPDQVRKLTKARCYICGKRPSLKHRRDKRYQTPYVYNGIDRLINRKGYVEGNVVACCWICNRAKGTLSIEKFLLYIHRAYNHIIKPAIEEGVPDEHESEE